jgi:hypothetical protein
VAFEQYAKARGVSIQAYHADNGIFRAHKWVKACWSKGQSLTFVGVNAHHQNGMAERRIRKLQEHAWTMLIHANQLICDSKSVALRNEDGKQRAKQNPKHAR